MFEGRFEHWRDRIARIVKFSLRRVDAAAVDPDANGAIVPSSLLDDEPNLFLPRLFTLVVVQVTGVVADLVDVRCDPLGETKILLQIDRQVRLRTATNFRQSQRIFVAVDSDPYDARAADA